MIKVLKSNNLDTNEIKLCCNILRGLVNFSPRSRVNYLKNNYYKIKHEYKLIISSQINSDSTTSRYYNA